MVPTKVCRVTLSGVGRLTVNQLLAGSIPVRQPKI